MSRLEVRVWYADIAPTSSGTFEVGQREDVRLTPEVPHVEADTAAEVHTAVEGRLDYDDLVMPTFHRRHLVLAILFFVSVFSK